MVQLLSKRKCFLLTDLTKGRKMKKYAILTSVLALTACGGGGHHSNGTPGNVRSAVSADAAASNAVITSMASEVLVGNGETLTPSLSRQGTTSYNGKTYTSYRLDDVTFRFSGEDSIIKFGLDDEGRIISAGKYDKNDSGKYELSHEGEFTRTSTTSSEFGSAKTLYAWESDFSGADRDDLETAITTALGEYAGQPGVPTADQLAGYIADKFDDPLVVSGDSASMNVGAAFKDEIEEEINAWATSQPWAEASWMDDVVEAAIAFYQEQIPSSFPDPTEYAAKLNVLGANIGLKYADLGFADLQIAAKDDPTDIVEQTFSPYIGGYDALEHNIEQTTEFTGTALAGIEHKATDGTKDAVLVRQDDAVLTMNMDGSSSLVMNNLAHVQNDGKTAHTDGAHWYTLTVDTAANGVPTFTVGGTNTIAGYDLPTLPTGGVVTFNSGNYNSHEGEYVKTDTDNDYRYGGRVENRVYGTSASDVEATSSFSFSNERPSTHEEVAVYGAFGGKPTE